MASQTGIVFNIQRFSIHDGPGIRTTIFLKGCTMKCFWCHNPEGRKMQPEICYYPDRCIECNECFKACPRGAHLIQNGQKIFIRERCESCGKCVQLCYAGALEFAGTEMTVEQVMEEILRDRLFYENSCGGVTLSGGEPMVQSEFTYELLKRCKVQGLHTAIQTCGNYPWESYERILPFIDLIMMDLKLMDQEKHKRTTGTSNDLILANARRLALTDKPIIFRTPVVPTVNDTDDEIRDIASFISNLIQLRRKRKKRMNDNGNIQFELMPFHKMAAVKYRSLGLEYQAERLNPPSKERMEQLIEIAKEFGITVNKK